MSENPFINFELADKLQYHGINGDQKEPEYAKIIPDFNKLIDFISQTGKVQYDPQQFVSRSGPILFDEFGSTTETPGVLVDENTSVYYVTVPHEATIRGEATSLKLNALFNVRSGTVDLDRPFPFGIILDPSNQRARYQLKIPYLEASKPYRKDAFALVLNSPDYHHMEYLIQSSRHTTKKKEDWLFKVFDRAMESHRGINQLDFLYEQAPLWIMARRQAAKRIEDLMLILQGPVNEIGINEELAVLNLLVSFISPPTSQAGIRLSQDQIKANIDFLLGQLIRQKAGNRNLLQIMYDKLSDSGGRPNFTNYIKLLHAFWSDSSYPEQTFSQSDDGEPLVLDYRTQKLLGFYTSKTKVKFKGDLLEIVKEMGTEINNEKLYHTYKAIFDTHIIHPFQPIQLQEINQSGVLKINDKVIPGFFLKAFHDKNVWANLGQAPWFAIDAITTATGVGNLLKLRHLTHVVRTYRYARLAIAGVEVSIGVLSLMLEYTNLCKDEDEDSFCQKLQVYLFYLELASLGYEAFASRFLRDTAAEALERMPKHLRNQYPEMVEELQKVSLAKHIEPKLLDKLTDYLAELGYSPRLKDRYVEIYDLKNKNRLIYTMDPGDFANYVKFISTDRKVIKTKISDAIKKLSKSPARFKSSRKKAQKLKLKASKNGISVDFRGTKSIYKKEGSSKVPSFQIRLTGSRTGDRIQAQRKLLELFGDLDKAELDKIKADYVWHHLDDLSPDLYYTVQLVKKSDHRVKHIGAVRIATEIMDIKYK